MTGIRKFQNSLMDDGNLNKFKMYLNKKEYGNKSKDSLTSILSSSENTYKSITSVKLCKSLNLLKGTLSAEYS